MACAGNNPSEDHSPKVEELLLDHKSNINALNNQKQTPIMLLFKSESEDEDIKKTSKFDPISTLMVLLKHKPSINLNLVDSFGKNVLHYACIRGSTISVLTLIDKGVDYDLEDYSKTTPFGYGIKNGHEDLCIFIMQKGYNVPKSIPSYFDNEDSELFKLDLILDKSISVSQYELLNQRKELLQASKKGTIKK